MPATEIIAQKILKKENWMTTKCQMKHSMASKLVCELLRRYSLLSKIALNNVKKYFSVLQITRRPLKLLNKKDIRISQKDFSEEYFRIASFCRCFLIYTFRTYSQKLSKALRLEGTTIIIASSAEQLFQHQYNNRTKRNQTSHNFQILVNCSP